MTELHYDDLDHQNDPKTKPKILELHNTIHLLEFQISQVLNLNGDQIKVVLNLISIEIKMIGGLLSSRSSVAASLQSWEKVVVHNIQFICIIYINYAFYGTLS